MQIAFWSPNHGQTGTTTAAMTYASIIAAIHNFKIMITHSQFGRSTLEQSMMKSNHLRQEELAYFNDHGLGALRRLAKNGRLNKGMISDYTTPLLPNKNLDLLEGALEGNALDLEEETALIRRIYEIASTDYDMIFVDIHSGLNLKLSEALINDADVVVVCLNQNKLLIDRFLEEEATKKVLHGKRLLYNIGFYDSHSKYTLKNLKRLYKFENLIALPYHTQLLDAGNASSTFDYLLRLVDVSSRDRQYKFSMTIKESSEQLLAMTEAVGQEVLEKDA